MKLTDILREIDDEQGGSNLPRESREVVLIPKTTPIPDIEDALNDLDNYGKYISYAQNTNVDVKKIKDAYFGPSGMGPKAKNKVTREIWDAADTSWRKFKLEDIKSRHPEINITGLESLGFEELPAEVRDPRVYFISPYTKDKLDTLIKSLSKSSNILSWYEDKGKLVFPRENNENIPGDETMVKIIKTVMNSAGITDIKIGKERDTEDGGTEFKSVSKTTQMSVPVESKAEASALRKELQAKFVIPSAGYKIKEDENGVSLSITGITISQKANITYYLEDKGILEESNWERRKMLILAGIIK
jgi:hypothetical protein